MYRSYFCFNWEEQRCHVYFKLFWKLLEERRSYDFIGWQIKEKHISDQSDYFSCGLRKRSCWYVLIAWLILVQIAAESAASGSSTTHLRMRLEFFHVLLNYFLRLFHHLKLGCTSNNFSNEQSFKPNILTLITATLSSLLLKVLIKLLKHISEFTVWIRSIESQQHCRLSSLLKVEPD